VLSQAWLSLNGGPGLFSSAVLAALGFELRASLFLRQAAYHSSHYLSPRLFIYFVSVHLFLYSFTVFVSSWFCEEFRIPVCCTCFLKSHYFYTLFITIAIIYRQWCGFCYCYLLGFELRAFYFGGLFWNFALFSNWLVTIAPQFTCRPLCTLRHLRSRC
jgi:hypothetical protein